MSVRSWLFLSQGLQAFIKVLTEEWKECTAHSWWCFKKKKGSSEWIKGCNFHAICVQFSFLLMFSFFEMAMIAIQFCPHSTACLNEPFITNFWSFWCLRFYLLRNLSFSPPLMFTTQAALQLPPVIVVACIILFSRCEVKSPCFKPITYECWKSLLLHQIKSPIYILERFLLSSLLMNTKTSKFLGLIFHSNIIHFHELMRYNQLFFCISWHNLNHCDGAVQIN